MAARLETVDLVDDTFVACDVAVLAQVVADPRRWRVWWPRLRLTTTRDRGVKGRQWAVQGALVGTAEIWLEPFWDGVLVHFYLRGRPAWPPGPGPSRGVADSARAGRLWAQEWKRHVHALKDELEGDRVPGGPSVTLVQGRDRPAEGPADRWKGRGRATAEGAFDE